MTNPTSAPRPCTLWGSTFDANHYWKVLFRNAQYGDAARVAVLSNDKHPARKHMQIASHLAESEDGFKVLPIARPAGELLQEAYFAIHQALHPPLCMKHALEIGYEFEERYYAFVRKGYRPQTGILKKIDTDSEVFYTVFWEDAYGVEHHYLLSKEETMGFYPVNHLGQPTHGDAEAVVNAWEGE